MSIGCKVCKIKVQCRQYIELRDLERDMGNDPDKMLDGAYGCSDFEPIEKALNTTDKGKQ